MTQVRFAPFLPASMQRKRKKFSAAFSGISDHPQKMGNGSNSTPQTAPAAKAAPQPGGSLPPPIEAGSRPGPGAERSVRARPPSCRRRGPFAGKAASRRAGQQASQVEESSRPGPSVPRPPSLVLPPPRPFHRQSRPAASRIAGITNRREQPTGDLRLPSFVPGKLQKGTGVPSWFPPSAERSWIIFRRGVYVAKNTSHEATCEPGPAPRGRTRFAPKRSA